ncbi:hypothetical protein BC826DRAFT_232313 [Russula brevipes]|nr:hypothetical protein BC826DRAFT_232313 [Russula brevipes]
MEEATQSQLREPECCQHSEPRQWQAVDSHTFARVDTRSGRRAGTNSQGNSSPVWSWPGPIPIEGASIQTTFPDDPPPYAPPAPSPRIDTNLTHGPPGSSFMREHQRQETGTSVAVTIQSPSTESFRGSSSTHARQLVDEPFSIDSETAHSSPISGPVTPQDESRLLSPAPSATSDFYCPEGRTVRAFTSDEVPRYTKNIKM